MKHAQKYQTVESKKVLFRYEEIAYSWGIDECGNPLPGYKLQLHLRTYPIARTTPCGAWIALCGLNDDRRFVNLQCRKKYACVTKKEALKSFRRRKMRQIEILSAQLEKAKRAMKLKPDETGTEPT